MICLNIGSGFHSGPGDPGTIRPLEIIHLRDAFKKKNSIWRDIVPTRGGGGKKKPLKCPYLKFHFTRELFSRESDSTITNVCSFVRLSVCLQNPSTASNHHPPSFILHLSSFFIHPSSLFIILHSSFLHFATFKLFSLF